MSPNGDASNSIAVDAKSRRWTALLQDQAADRRRTATGLLRDHTDRRRVGSALRPDPFEALANRGRLVRVDRPPSPGPLDPRSVCGHEPFELGESNAHPPPLDSFESDERQTSTTPPPDRPRRHAESASGLVQRKITTRIEREWSERAGQILDERHQRRQERCALDRFRAALGGRIDARDAKDDPLHWIASRRNHVSDQFLEILKSHQRDPPIHEVELPPEQSRPTTGHPTHAVATADASVATRSGRRLAITPCRAARSKNRSMASIDASVNSYRRSDPM